MVPIFRALFFTSDSSGADKKELLSKTASLALCLLLPAVKNVAAARQQLNIIKYLAAVRDKCPLSTSRYIHSVKKG